MSRDGAGQALDEIKARAERSLELYLNPPTDNDVPRPSRIARGRSSVPLKCAYCDEYLPEGSRAQRQCLACGCPVECNQST